MNAKPNYTSCTTYSKCANIIIVFRDVLDYYYVCVLYHSSFSDSITKNCVITEESTMQYSTY